MRQPNIHGGGAKTNRNGLSFEKRTDFITALENNPDIETEFDPLTNRYIQTIYYKDEEIGAYTEKHDFYKYIESFGINWKERVSKKYLPDGVFINFKTNVLYVIEKKFQETSGSVDEKLQTCDFKRKTFEKIAGDIFNKVNYYYLLNDYFMDPQYDDVKAYIESVGCKYFIEEISLNELGIVD
tara:strand:- start:1090 stop:1638 length:549 start_codon:yes stop_codon:yes gene_type:complete